MEVEVNYLREISCFFFQLLIFRLRNSMNLGGICVDIVFLRTQMHGEIGYSMCSADPCENQIINDTVKSILTGRIF